MITKAMYNDWKNHPVTIEYFGDLRDAKQVKEDELVYGHNIENHAQMAQSIGLVRAFDSAINYEPEFNEDGYMLDEEGLVVE